jgi:diguanylate cyclase (GGDEF)-like protein
VVQQVCLVAVLIVAGTILLAWLIPALGHALPAGWNIMRANTALLAIVSAVSLGLSQPRRTPRQVSASRLLGVFVAALSLGTLAEYVFGVSLHIDKLLPTNPSFDLPGRMAPQTAVSFALLAVVLIFIRQRKRRMSVVADLIVCTLCAFVLANASGYLFNAMQLFGISGIVRTAPTTLICLMLLSFVAFGRRAEHGVCGILLGTGIGSRIARIAFPIVLVLPFALEVARAVTVNMRLLQPQYATAISTAIAVVLAFLIILVLAWRIDSLEKEIRDLSLRDELTDLYNRRGFYMLAEQALRMARRARTTFSVLFVDLDDLKQINDTLGHAAGSEFLKEVAQLLQHQLRRSDILGRVGGDEFVVAGEMTEAAVLEIADRLERVSAAQNEIPGRPYSFRFSIGHATSNLKDSESLQMLLHRADGAMYRNKRKNKTLIH